jgi:hypothetical protein
MEGLVIFDHMDRYEVSRDPRNGTNQSARLHLKTMMDRTSRF